MQEESRCKTRAGHLITKMSRSLLLGCDFSSLGLRYSLRKPLVTTRGVQILKHCPGHGSEPARGKSARALALWTDWVRV
jgi:hypothetical protein